MLVFGTYTKISGMNSAGGKQKSTERRGKGSLHAELRPAVQSTNQVPMSAIEPAFIGTFRTPWVIMSNECSLAASRCNFLNR